MQEYDDIKRKPLNYETKPEFAFGASEELDVKVEQQEKVPGKRKPLITEKKLEVNKEYSLKEPLRKEGSTLQLAPKITVLSQTLGGEYEVRLPNGQVKFITPTEFKNYNISDENNTSEEMEAIFDKAIDTVLDKEEYADYKEELNIAGADNIFNKRAFVNDLDNQKLIDAIEKEFNKQAGDLIEKKEKQVAQQKQLVQNKEQIIKQQTELEHDSGTIATSNQIPAELFREGKLIDAEALFLSSTTESEGLEDSTKSAQHIKNSRVFLNNIAEFPNRSNIKAILVTPKQVAGLNLNGLVQMSYGKELSDSVDSIEDVNSIDNGFVAQVFVEQNKDGLFYVNKEGEIIGKVGEDLGDNLKNIIFQTMRTTSLTYRNGNPRYRSEQEAEARAYAAAWKEYRTKLFNAEATEFPTFEFFVSAGIPIEIKTADGIKEKNHVGGILIKEELISNQANLIVVPTKGTITNSRGEIQKTPNGVPVLQYGDTLQFLNNRSFNNREAEGIYETIRRLANQTVEQSNTGQAISFNKQFTKFLQNVLYWKSKADTSSPNQIGIDEKTLSLNLGNKSFPLAEIDNYKKEIIDHLTDAKTFNSINTKTLTDLQSSPFEEWYINQEGNFVSSKWANYQTYLLSNKYPSGKARPIGDTPLSTSIAKPTEAVPYSFQQRYSTITQPDSFNVQVIATPAKKEEKKEEVPTPKIFEFKAGPVQYTSQEDADGNIIVEVERSATTKAVAVDTDSLEVVINALKAANKFDASIPKGEEETYVTDFMAMQIAASLKAEKLKQQEAPKAEEVVQPMAPPEVVAQQDIEAQKADIEKRRQEEAIKKLTVRKQYIESSKDGYRYILIKNFKQSQVNKGLGEFKYVNDDINGKFRVSIETPSKLTEFFGSSNDMQTDERDVKNIEFFNTFREAIVFIGEETNNPNFKEINAKYDAELAALEGGKEKETPPSEFPSGDFRRVGKDGQERMTDVELTLFKEWHASNVPNIPFEVLDNIITTYDGEKAWGVFENGVAKFVKGGLRATEYHEIFEGIYKGMLSSEEQQALLSEFKNRDGFFTDRQTGKKIPFLEATDLQAKERIADDFSDFRKGKLPARSLGEAIRNFFTKIMNFFKSFVNNPSLKEDLFKSINEGKFKERTLSPSIITEAPEYRPVEDLTVQQANNFVQDILARASGILFRDGEKGLLFNPQGITGTEMFNKVEEMYIAEGRRQLLSDKTWGQLKERVKDKLRIQGINFNEEEVHDINNDETNKNDYVSDPFTVEGKKSATPAVKFLLSTQIERESTNQESALTLNTPPPSFSEMKIKGFPIKGYKLMDYSRTFATLLDKLSNTSSVSTFTDKLFNLAQDDANYVGVFQKIGGKDKVIPFKDFKANDWRLFIDFMQTFARQKPDALIQYKSVDSVHTGAANLFTANKQTQQAWMENIKTLAKGTGTIVNFNNKLYTIDKEALQDMPLRKAPSMIEFLNAIGIEFDLDTYNKLKSYQKTGKNGFTEQVQSIYAFFGSNNNLMSISGKTLDIDGPLSILAELYNKVNNPSQESTYFGVENQRIGAFSENNAPSIFEDEFNEADTVTELKQTRTELNDVFSAGSQVLKEGGLFYDKDGKQRKDFKVSYIQGEKNQDTDKGTSTSKLKIGDRYTLEINQNLNGNYYILMPADGSTEWMMNIGNNVSFDSIQSGSYKDINAIFKGYLMDDINLALDFANREKLLNVGDKGKELRFFKDILADEQLSAINEMIEDNESLDNIKKYVDTNIGAINNSVKEFIDGMNTGTKNLLVENKKIIVGEKTSKYLDLDANFAKANSLNKNALTEKSVDDIINFANTNYIIANIEYHKILFGDPYQFAIKKDGSLDQTKRIKSWLSPRRTTFDSPEFNTFLNNNANKADGIKLEDYVYDAETNTWTGDLGGHKFKSHTNTITIKDVTTAGSLANINELFGDNNEADAVSWLRDTTHREIKLKNKQWNLEGKEEEFFQWQMAFTRQNLPGYKYSNTTLEAHDKALMETPMPKHKLEILKPIVTGNKFNKNNFDQVLDKFSQVPIYYSMVKGTNLEKLYIQMMKQDIGYAIVESGRKVGTQETHSLYNGDGSFNNEAFSEESIVQVPWKAYGIQVETASSDNKLQTRGSQLTKLASMDIFDNGVASSVEAEKEYNRNKEILDLMHANGYKELLIDLGIEDLGTEYVMKDGTSISETLMREMKRREVSDNTKDTLDLNTDNQFNIPFEASPSYTQIRSILYSMIDKAIGSPKMTGGAHVQMPATMLESATKGRSIVMKNKEGVWEKITREKYATLTAAQKANVMLTDDTLKFYTKAEPWCEVYMPHWFKDKFKGKFKNDRELLNYLNSTTEGKAILSGIGFRIPTQALSSVEVFRVKGFLPQYMGSTVVVPSEITTKAGSDFDIDKLNMYLKSIYVDSKGDIKLVKYLNSEEATKEFFGRIYDETILKDIQKIKDSDAFREELYNFLDPATVVSEIGATRQQVFYDQNEALINEIISQADDADKSPVDYINDQIQMLAGKEAKLNAKLLNDTLRNRYVKEMYKKSLENEYYDSLEKLITLPENFDRLISPIDDAGLKKLAGKLDDLRQTDETSVPNRILNRNFMTPLRNSFVMGKKWVGIVAVNITNLSLKQKSQVYIDPKRFQLVSLDDQVFLGDGTIALKHNTTMVNGEEMISLSGTTVKDSTELISSRLSGYATAVVDVAKDDFITRIIQSDLVIGTFMFLENIGVGKQTAFFLNQPIISEYLKIVNANNASNLFDKKNITAVKDKFGAKVTFIKKSTINLDNLESNISDYYNDVKFDEARNAEQLRIFSEFLKYAKMAEYNFSFTQATNYDTSRFGSGDMFARKEWATQAANDVNIISSAKNILDSTFIGTQSKLMSKSMKAMSAVFNLERDDLRIITESIMKVYGKNKYLSQDNFNKISNKAKMAFLDYIIQTKTGVSDRTYALLINPKSSVATKLERAKIRYPFIQILKELQVTPSDRIDGAKSIQLRVNDKSAESENLNQEMMRELRDYNEETKELYNDIISVAILQGSYQSAISIKNIIPIEDYSAIVAPVVASISSTESLKAFSEGFFERNNFDDPLIMPRVIPFFKEKIEPGDDPFSEYRMYKSESFPTLEGLGLDTMDRQVMLITDKYNQKAMNSNYVAVNKVTKLKDGTRVDVTTGKTITKRDYAVSLSKGDYSLNDLIGYKRVLLASGEPLRIFDDRGENLQSVYKMVNLYGDGAKASEFYTRFKPSVIDNGTLPVKREIDDRDIVNYYGGEIAKETVSLPTETIKSEQVAGKPKGVKVKEGIYVNQEALSKDEQLELFDYLKPFLEEQAAKTNKGVAASKMIGLGLRWDYKSNNPGKQAMNIPDVINPGNKAKYGYYNTSINNQALAPITPRFRELMQKATGVDMTNYDGAIINLYEPTSFISSHNDVDESRSAIGYPVIGINIGGTGNFSIESRDGSPKQLDLNAGAGYVFGVDGVNREVYHRTFAKPQDSFLPELNTKIDGKTYEPGSYRVTVTMRRVMPLEQGMPTKPTITSTENEKPEGISQEEWDGLSQEEKNKIKEC
jgi:alkylated DNA repair dioxygenase AlkB